eukprot:2675048-Pleurochrysis_carterae.AAC.1
MQLGFILTTNEPIVQTDSLVNQRVADMLMSYNGYAADFTILSMEKKLEQDGHDKSRESRYRSLRQRSSELYPRIVGTELSVSASKSVPA